MQPYSSRRTLHRLHSSEIKEASQVLARAFLNDPLQTHVFPDAQKRAALSPAHFEPIVRYGELAGEVWTTADPLDGVAIWLPPEHIALDPEKLNEAGFFALPDAIGGDAFRRFTALLDYVEPFHRDDMPRPHWYAMVIGVDQNAQGRGIGSLLLEPALSRADEDGLPCYLETCQPANVRFYGKHGFHVVRHGTEPRSGLDYWTFIRDSR